MAEAPTPIAEIDHGPSKFEQFLDNHQTKLIIGAILIALGVLGYVIWSGLQEAEEHDAGSALLKADEVADYQDVIKKYPSSNASASAMPLLADLQWQDSQPDAISTLQDFIAQHPEHPAVDTANVSLGLRLLEQGKTDEATETLSTVAESNSDSYMAPLACIALGDIAKAKGDLAGAKNWYEKAKGDGERTNAFLDMASSRLAIVNAKPPVKIKPAPPKPPTPPKPPGKTNPVTPKPGDKAPAVPAPPTEKKPSEPADKEKAKPDTNAKAPEPALPAPKLTIPDGPEKAPDGGKSDTQPAPPEKPEGKPEPTL